MYFHRSSLHFRDKSHRTAISGSKRDDADSTFNCCRKRSLVFVGVVKFNHFFLDDFFTGLFSRRFSVLSIHARARVCIFSSRRASVGFYLRDNSRVCIMQFIFLEKYHIFEIIFLPPPPPPSFYTFREDVNLLFIEMKFRAFFLVRIHKSLSNCLGFLLV